MRIFITIDQVLTHKWKLTLSEAVLFSWLTDLSQWADGISVKGEPYFHATYRKAVQDLPSVSEKVDTIYRIYKKLEKEHGLIRITMIGNNPYVAITKKGKAWRHSNNSTLKNHSEIPPENKKESDPFFDNSDFGAENNGNLSALYIDSKSIDSQGIYSFPNLQVNAREEEKKEEKAIESDLTKDNPTSGTDIPKQQNNESSAEKTPEFDYPAFTSDAPSNIFRQYEQAVKEGKKAVEQFEYDFRNVIDWARCKSQKGEHPIDHDLITPEYLDKFIPFELKFKKVFAGVIATTQNHKLTKKDHYIYLYNYTFLTNPYNSSRAETMLKQVTSFVEPYYNILLKIHNDYITKKK